MERKASLRFVAFVLCVSLLLCSCGRAAKPSASTKESSSSTNQSEAKAVISDTTITEATQESDTVIVIETAASKLSDTDVPSFTGLDDNNLLQYVEDSVYADLEYIFASDDYVIENVNAVYISQEYLDELAYNSKSNIMFGFTVSELDAQFQGTKYVFTLGANGQTIVQPLQVLPDDTYERVIKNIAIGTGVILVCVTVSVVSAALGATTVSLVFAAAAEKATTFALSWGRISAVSAAVITGYQTGDVKEALKAAALSGSEAFKWGAITGAVFGGAKEAYALHTAAKATAEAAKTAGFAVEKVDTLNNVSYISTKATSIPLPEEAEQIAATYYKAQQQQISYLAGKEVPWGTPGATRPDVIRTVGNHLEAIEVKRYDLSSPSCVSRLFSELDRQISSRAANLPEGSTQRICLNVQGRGFSQELITEVVSKLRNMFPTVPIDVIL